MKLIRKFSTHVNTRMIAYPTVGASPAVFPLQKKKE
jgi:hypothetical protein